MMALGHVSYLVHLLMYAGPLVLLQGGLLVWRYKARTPAVLRALIVPVLVVSSWLSAADHLAIRAQVWMFDDAQLTGVKIGFVPIEEVAFFVLTSLLVAFGVVLFMSHATERRSP